MTSQSNLPGFSLRLCLAFSLLVAAGGRLGAQENSWAQSFQRESIELLLGREAPRIAVIGAGRASEERAAAVAALRRSLGSSCQRCALAEVADVVDVASSDTAIAARLAGRSVDALLTVRVDAAGVAPAPIAWLSLLRRDGALVSRWSAVRGEAPREWVRLDGDDFVPAATLDETGTELLRFATPLAPGKLPELRPYVGEDRRVRLEVPAFLRQVGRADLAERFAPRQGLRSRLIVAGTLLMGLAMTAAVPTLYATGGHVSSRGEAIAFGIEAAAFATGVGCLLAFASVDPYPSAFDAVSLADQHNAALRRRRRRSDSPSPRHGFGVAPLVAPSLGGLAIVGAF